MMTVIFALCLIVSFIALLFTGLAMEDGEGGIGCVAFIVLVVFGTISYLTVPEGLFTDNSKESEKTEESHTEPKETHLERGLILQREVLEDTMKIELGVYRIQVTPADLVDSKTDSILNSWDWKKEEITNSYFYQQ